MRPQGMFHREWLHWKPGTFALIGARRVQVLEVDDKGVPSSWYNPANKLVTSLVASRIAWPTSAEPDVDDPGTIAAVVEQLQQIVSECCQVIDQVMADNKHLDSGQLASLLRAPMDVHHRWERHRRLLIAKMDVEGRATVRRPSHGEAMLSLMAVLDAVEAYWPELRADRLTRSRRPAKHYMPGPGE